VAAPTTPDALSPDRVTELASRFSGFIDDDALWPVRVAGARFAPALLLHGEADDVVADTHSTRLYDRLRDVGVNVARHTYPDADHTMDPFGFFGERGADAMRRIVAWFRAHLPD
jgi:dipeptidyl aminopeptidase/acylaminoacyl peptidase